MVGVVRILTPCEMQALTRCKLRKLPGSTFSVLELLQKNLVYGNHLIQDTIKLVGAQAK